MISFLAQAAAGIAIGSAATIATVSVTGEQVDLGQALVGAAVGLVAITVAYIAWHRRELRMAIRDHERVEKINDERRHEEIMGVLRMLTQRLVDRGVLPESSPSGSWPALTPAPIRSRRDDDTEDR